MGVKSLFLTNHLLGKDFIPALQNNGGQALRLLTIALKPDSKKTNARAKVNPRPWESC